MRDDTSHRHGAPLGDAPSAGSVLEFITDFCRAVTPVLCRYDTQTITRLRNSISSICRVIERIAKGKTLVPDHGHTDTKLYVERDPRGQRPAPTVALANDIEFFVSITGLKRGAHGGRLHAHATVSFRSFRTGKTSPTEISFDRMSLIIPAANVFASLETLMPFEDAPEHFSDKLNAICATYIARKYKLLATGGDKSYSFRLVLKNDASESTEAIEVPLHHIAAAHA